MSASICLHGAWDRLSVDSGEGTIYIRSRNEFGMSINTVALTLTSADRDALRAALDTLDTSGPDADAADEEAAA